MKKANGRNLATSLTTTVFFVIATTGVMMYFHILDQYTKKMHEILGLVFVVAAFLHVFFNWASMRTYFKKKIFIFSVLLISMVSLGFIISASNEKGGSPKGAIIDSVLKSPFEVSSKVLDVDMSKALDRLKKEGLSIEKIGSIEEVAKTNKTSPFRVVGLMLEAK